MRSGLNHQKSSVDTDDKVDTAITEEMAYDYAAFLLDLWHSGKMVNKINREGEASMDEG